MTSELKKLYELQKTDSGLAEQRREVDRHEGALLLRRGAIAECAQRESAVAAERGALVHRRALLEREVEDLNSKLRDRKQRQNAVASTREFDASKVELRDLSRDIEGHEEQLYEIEVEVEQVEARLLVLQKEREDLEQADHRQVEDEGGRINELRAVLEKAAEERQLVAGDIEASALKRYETVLKRGAGLAVVEVEGEACTGCHVRIPPQVLIDIRRSRSINHCPSCQRILFLVSAED
ncbi:MAG: hypothetical protein H8E45_13320 [Proteobacteria bacterium]|nr:hypothetical protein [Pseudomonadota bacterium]